LFRFVDLGVPRFMVATSVQAVIAQRLLRRVCESCSEPHIPTPQEIIWMEMEGLSREQWSGLKNGRGCSHCNGTGYYGRMGVYEMLEMNREMVEAAAHDSATHFMHVARQHMQGKTMLDHALEEMKRGHTTAFEVMSISNRIEE
jgi:MSHA biogenesis protein MshE